ncbi:MAG: hypothetical protein HY420_02835 [Candidatus Kerfeldbacteria bacterium]|nr:hypothetical protein [Candidatus Kerfeldbacteria bacterium]
MPRTIITIQAPAGADLSPALPYLDRAGDVEIRAPSLIYLNAGVSPSAKRLRRKLVLLRETVQALLNIHVRLGAASSKTVSLVAARHSPPGGLTIVPNGDEAKFLEAVVIDLLPGIGRRTATYLRNRGVNTIGKFARLPQTAAVQLFGLAGIILREFSRGADPRDVIPHSPPPAIKIGRGSLLSLFATPLTYSTLGVGAGARPDSTLG